MSCSEHNINIHYKDGEYYVKVDELFEYIDSQRKEAHRLYREACEERGKTFLTRDATLERAIVSLHAEWRILDQVAYPFNKEEYGFYQEYPEATFEARSLGHQPGCSFNKDFYFSKR